MLGGPAAPSGAGGPLRGEIQRHGRLPPHPDAPLAGAAGPAARGSDRCSYDPCWQGTGQKHFVAQFKGNQGGKKLRGMTRPCRGAGRRPGPATPAACTTQPGAGPRAGGARASRTTGRPPARHEQPDMAPVAHLEPRRAGGRERPVQRNGVIAGRAPAQLRQAIADQRPLQPRLEHRRGDDHPERLERRELSRRPAPPALSPRPRGAGDGRARNGSRDGPALSAIVARSAMIPPCCLNRGQLHRPRPVRSSQARNRHSFARSFAPVGPDPIGRPAMTTERVT